MSILLQVLAFIGLIVIAIYLWIQKRFKYWSDHGIPCPSPSFPYGTLKMGKDREHTSQSNTRYYHAYKNKSPICGLFFTIKPAILALDINLIKNILIKDFNYFHDRGVYFNDKADPLAGHIFNLEGQRWKTLRAKLTPTFTSGKMKFMFPTMVNVGNEFVKTLNEEIGISNEIEMKEFLARFTTDVIGSCAFGLECNSLKDPNAKFREMGKKVFEAPRNNRFKQFLVISFKQAGRFFNVKTVRDDVAEFFMKVVKDTVEYREKNDVKRNDFMDLLLNLKNSVNEEERLTLNEIAAQAFVFFLAGFETSSTAMSYALYELAQNQEMQEKARKSIHDALKNHNNEITYESVNEMAYIDHCINGEGPRICIGLRFGMLQARIGLALLLKHFKFTLSEKTEVPLTFSPTNIVLTPKGGLHLILEKLE
uniref:CSON003181 protein n=1 Tax=Culicoides sonorensis TaxID=179676 RepID=A0A336LVD5_CULSO